MKTTIRTRILLPLALLMVFLPLGTYVAFSFVAERHMTQLAQSSLASTLESVRAIVQQVYGEYNERDKSLDETEKRDRARKFMVETRSALRRRQYDSSIIVLNRKYEVLYPSEADEETVAIAQSFDPNTAAQSFDAAQFVRINLDGRDYIAYMMRLTDPQHTLSNYLIAYSMISDTGALLRTSALFVLGITAVLALGSLCVAWLTATSISAPIGKLCGQLSSIGEGSFAPVEQHSSVVEIAALISAANSMAKRLSRYDQAQKTFFQNASHELRTPLMSIQGYAEGIQLNVWPSPAQAAGVIADESRRLTELVDELLALSRLDNDQQPLEIESIDLTAFLDNTMDRLRGMALTQNVALESLPSPPAVWIRADEQLLTKSVQNVLSNAIRYASTRVTARIIAQDEAVLLVISDDGPGIPPETAERIFDRFYKGAQGNFGIGLSVARSSMEYMGGAICVAPSEQGAAFELRFVPAD